MTYKLYQLLKLRKKLISEIRTLENKFKENNSKIDGSEWNYKSDTLMKSILSKKDELVRLKTTIHKYTLHVYPFIFEIEEIKDLINLLKGTPTTNGLELQGGRFGSEVQKIMYKAIYTQVDVDNMIKEYEEKIEKLQEKIDYHNHTTDVEFE